MSDFAERKDSFVSASYTSQKRRLNARRNHGAPMLRQLQRSETPVMMGQPYYGTKYDNKAHSDTTHFEQLYNMARRETSSNSLSGIEQEAERCTEQYARPLRDLVNNRTYVQRGQKLEGGSKPLPEVPTGLKETSVNDSIEDEDEARLYYGKNLGFSFIPGDDYGNLALGRERTQATVLALGGFGNRGRPSSSYLPSSSDVTDPVPPQKQRRKRPVLGKRRETNTVEERKPTPSYEFEPMRSDSQTSIVTAVPDQYAGRSECPEHVRDAPSRPKPSHLSSSNEAIIAAVRAVAEERLPPELHRYDTLMG